MIVACMHKKLNVGKHGDKGMFWRECITDVGGRKERLNFCEVSFLTTLVSMDPYVSMVRGQCAKVLWNSNNSCEDPIKEP